MTSTSPMSAPFLSRRDHFIGAALLLFASLICYIPALGGDFVWDDDRHVSANRTLRSWRGLHDIWLDRGATPQYYPLTHTSFWIEYRVWELNPTGYHVINVLLHGLNAALVWQLLRRLGVPGAFLAAAVFALHPVQVESVAWISERKNVLAACFMLLSILAYLRFTRLGYALSLLLFACALLSKTITCSMPAVLVLLLWWKNRLTIGQLLILTPFFALGLVTGLATAQMEVNHIGARGPEWELSFHQRCLIASQAIWFYVGKLVWPAQLTFSYPRWEIDTRDAWQYVPMLALVAVIGALVLSVKRLGRGPLIAAFIYMGTLFPALGFFNTYPMRYSFVADHFQYLSSIAFIALVVSAVATAWNHWLMQPRIDAIRVRFAVMNSALLLVVLGVLTWRQAHVYANAETLWRDTIEKNPTSWMARNNLGAVLLAIGRGDLEAGRTNDAQRRLAEAIALFEQVESDRPLHLNAALSRAQALEMLQRQDAAMQVYEQLVSKFHEYLTTRPDDAMTRTSFGLVLGKLGRFEEAREQFEEALRIEPRVSGARQGLDMVRAATGQP